MFKRIFISYIIALPIVLAALLLTGVSTFADDTVSGIPSPFPSEQQFSDHKDNSGTDLNYCGDPIKLYGSVNNNTASVSNYSTNPDCEYSATLAIYNIPNTPVFNSDGSVKDADVEDQIFINSNTVAVSGTAKNISISVDDTYNGSSCWRQADLIPNYSNITPTPLVPPKYTNLLASQVYNVCTTPTPSATPSATEIPTPGPTATPTPGSSNNNSTSGSGSSGGSSGSSSNSTPQQVAAATAVLASTGNALSIYAIVLGGAISLISGMVLRKAGK